MADSLFGERPLKKAGSKAIEEAITKAITELAEEEYKADIQTIDFNPSNNSWMSDTVKITLSISKKKNWWTDRHSETQTEVQTDTPITTRTCRLCDSSGFRFIKDDRQPNGSARKCTHDPEIESKIPSFYNS
ncbi:MAG: hypothetical protein WCB68_02440 [Pyrinomonadaceae bacterium]